MNLEPIMIRPGEPATRRCQLIDPRPGLVRAWVEDNFHDFMVEIAHDGTVVTELRTLAKRWPWSTCPAAGVHLGERMRGARLAELALVDTPYSHCTHMHDLALLAAAHALEDEPVLYATFAADGVHPAQHAELWRNGERVLAWDVADSIVSSSDGIDGRSLRHLRQWQGELPADLAEMCRVLRRTIFISGGRSFDYSKTPTADKVAESAGACFTFQPHRSAGGVCTMDIIEFDAGPGPLAQTIRTVARERG